MTNKEAIDRWAELIIPAVFKAEDALQKAKPEWKERLKHLGEPGGEDPTKVASEYCHAIAHIIVTQGSDYEPDGTLPTSEQLSPEMEALLSRKTEELDLSVRTRNILKANGIDTVRDLCRLKRTHCLYLRNCGKKSLTELEDFLTAHGLTWGMNF